MLTASSFLFRPTGTRAKVGVLTVWETRCRARGFRGQEEGNQSNQSVPKPRNHNGMFNLQSNFVEFPYDLQLEKIIRCMQNAGIYHSATQMRSEQASNSVPRDSESGPRWWRCTQTSAFSLSALAFRSATFNAMLRQRVLSHHCVNNSDLKTIDSPQRTKWRSSNDDSNTQTLSAFYTYQASTDIT